MQKTELQVMCLEELQTHYSQQMDVIINNNRTLSHEIRVAMRKLKTTEIVSTLYIIRIYILFLKKTQTNVFDF